MKNWIMLSLALLSLTTFSAFANSEVEGLGNEEEVSTATVEMDGEGYAKLDDSIFCSVAMVNWRRQIVRRYSGVRSPRTYRCTLPMAKCRSDLRHVRRGPFNRGLRCVELRY